jgi:BCD family chlorophyll transporter-like MFS transporter
VASLGALTGVFAFAGIIFAPSLGSILLFRVATVCIGFGSGLFAVGMLTSAMELADRSASGLALGAWGAVQATAAGVAVALSGGLRDGIGTLARNGKLGFALQQPATGYSFVYHTEILLLFATLVALGPLVRVAGQSALPGTRRFGLVHHPG